MWVFSQSLTLEEVKEITHSTHPECINKDLQKVHAGKYKLHDNYYFGVDREHNFKHLTCGTVFSHTVYRIKTEKYPCPTCRKDHIKRDTHDESNKLLTIKSNGRYTLDLSYIGLDKKGRRFTHCNRCKNSWWVTVGNLIGNKANCPNCLDNQQPRPKGAEYELDLNLLARRDSR